MIIWKQRATDAKNAADSAKTYDFAESVTLTGNVGSTITAVTATGTGNDRYASVNGTEKRYTGFHLGRYDTGVTINSSGNAVVNVYYDRDVYTLRFDIGFARRTGNNGSSTIYTKMSESEAAAYTGNPRTGCFSDPPQSDPAQPADRGRRTAEDSRK